MKKYILALDQGTTSSRAILFDENHRIVATAQREFTQIYPQEGWIEHDPMEIYSTQYGVMAEAVAKSGIDPHEIAAAGITNQRETTVVWDKNTGRPVYNAIVWQCRRTSGIIDKLNEKGLGEIIRQKTGLVPDAYFSGTKIQWILDNVEGAREKAERGELLFGTIDTWLVWKLTEGRVHVTDYTNASRTMLYNIREKCWDPFLLNELHIPASMLPKVCPSSMVYGSFFLQGAEIPIAGMAGDQQSALFGQCCFQPGQAKNTFGTGCFMLMNTGDQYVESKNGLLTTLAVNGEGKVCYALEGSVFIGGAVMQWLRDELRFFSDSSDAEYLAQKVKDTGGVYLVPAFAGLGAPHWDMYARGCIVGITRGTKREHIVRAAEESIAYQIVDLMDAMEKDTGITLEALNADGGATRDAFLMQLQADLLNKAVRRPAILETTALGAASLAGLAVGFWQSSEEIAQSLRGGEKLYHPHMEQAVREKMIAGWHKAVGRSLRWEDAK